MILPSNHDSSIAADSEVPGKRHGLHDCQVVPHQLADDEYLTLEFSHNSGNCTGLPGTTLGGRLAAADSRTARDLDRSEQEVTNLTLDQGRLTSEIKCLVGQGKRLTSETSELLDKCQQLTTEKLSLSTQLSSKTDAYQTLEESYQIDTAMLDAIMRSHGWKAMGSYYKMREALLPAGSARRRLDAIKHYLRYGASEGRDPNQYFDSDWYFTAEP